MVVRSVLAEKTIGCAIEVHKVFGPGLFETAYEPCLAKEFDRCGIKYARQLALPVTYKGMRIDCGYRVDFLVEGELVVELKAVERILPVHDAQVLTYMRLLKVKQGLLFNFNAKLLVKGLRSYLL